LYGMDDLHICGWYQRGFARDTGIQG